MGAQLLQLCPTLCDQLFVTLWTVAHQDALFKGFSRQESGVDCCAPLQCIFLTQ